jgi:hypothetical protein
MLREDLNLYLTETTSNISTTMSPNPGQGCLVDEGLAFICSEPAGPDVILDAYENDDFWLPSRSKTGRIPDDLDPCLHSVCTTACSASVSTASMGCVSGKKHGGVFICKVNRTEMLSSFDSSHFDRDVLQRNRNACDRNQYAEWFQNLCNAQGFHALPGSNAEHAII